MKTLRKGFTLVEMLIVIVIIGILAAALIPRLTGAQAQARDTARLADLNQMGTALAVFQADNADYPAKNALASLASTTLATVATNGYIKAIPTDPQANNSAFTINTFSSPNGQYVYQTVNSGNSFILVANNEVPKKGNMLAASGALATVLGTGVALTTVQSNIVAGNTLSADSIFVYAN